MSNVWGVGLVRYHCLGFVFPSNFLIGLIQAVAYYVRTFGVGNVGNKWGVEITDVVRQAS